MNGAEALARTLASASMTACFAKPGGSRQESTHLVAALDQVPRAPRGVPCLFEGVATGAADGFGRMTGRPAATLLHLGPGLGNGLAKLHNARRGHTPAGHVVGDHATYRKRYDAPLESDIDALAGRCPAGCAALRRADLAGDAAEAVAAASNGTIATLMVPADVAWAGGPNPRRPSGPAAVARPEQVIAKAAKMLRGDEPTLILLGGAAVRRAGLEAASRIAAATGARLPAGLVFPGPPGARCRAPRRCPGWRTWPRWRCP